MKIINNTKIFFTRFFKEFYNNTLKFWIELFTKKKSNTKKYKSDLEEHSFKDYPLAKRKLEAYNKYVKENSDERNILKVELLIEMYQETSNLMFKVLFRHLINLLIWDLEKKIERKL